MDNIFKTQISNYEGESSDISCVLLNVYRALEKKGYEPIHQIEGFILSGDPTYITSYDGARKSITSVERDELIVFLLKYYFYNIV